MEMKEKLLNLPTQESREISFFVWFLVLLILGFSFDFTEIFSFFLPGEIMKVGVDQSMKNQLEINHYAKFLLIR